MQALLFNDTPCEQIHGLHLMVRQIFRLATEAGAHIRRSWPMPPSFFAATSSTRKVVSLIKNTGLERRLADSYSNTFLQTLYWAFLAEEERNFEVLVRQAKGAALDNVQQVTRLKGLIS